MRVIGIVPLVGIAVLGSAPAHAQTPPPIQGVTGTIATEATIRDEHKAANTIAVETKDGVEDIYDAVTGTVIHSGKNALTDLKPGTTVIIHSRANNAAQDIDRVGEGGLRTTEGIATRVDRRKKEITIRYDNGTIEKLKLNDRAAADAGRTIPPDTRIIVYSDEAGAKVTHYFTTIDRR